MDAEGYIWGSLWAWDADDVIRVGMQFCSGNGCFHHFCHTLPGAGQVVKIEQGPSSEINWNPIDSCLRFRIDDVAVTRHLGNPPFSCE
jgi:hypothetical protein